VKRPLVSLGVVLFTVDLAAQAYAQSAAPPSGGLPPDSKPVVAPPAAPAETPKVERPLDGTTASLSAGGMLVTGNLRSLALSGNGSFETRFHGNGLGASVVGNDARGAAQGDEVAAGVEYLQSLVDAERARLNVDAVLAAKLLGGRHFGFGFSARHDNLSLPGKTKLDTSSTVSVIDAWSDDR